MIFVNFKTYKASTGENAVKLAILCEVVSEQYHLPIVPIVQTVDLWRVTQHVHIPVWIQNIGFKTQGKNTGYTTIESVLESGAQGTLLNHSEHQLAPDFLQKTLLRISEVAREFQTMVCCPNEELLKLYKSLNPNSLAYEPPELISSETDSVATKYADVIAKAVEIANPHPLIVGAGIRSKEDIITSLEKGAKGILVSNAIVNADNQQEILEEFAKVFVTN